MQTPYCPFPALSSPPALFVLRDTILLLGAGPSETALALPRVCCCAVLECRM